MLSCLCFGVVEVGLLMCFGSSFLAATLTKWYNRRMCRKHKCHHNCGSDETLPVVTDVLLMPNEMVIVEDVLTGETRQVVGKSHPTTGTPVILKQSERIVPPGPAGAG